MAPEGALRLGRHLGLGAPHEQGSDDAMKRLYARFGRDVVERPPGVDVVAFERGAVWREREGESWRPAPAALPSSGSFFDQSYEPLSWTSEAVLDEVRKGERGEPTWAHPNDLTRQELDRLVANMKSHVGPVRTDPRDGMPLNPGGPTGLAGRGAGNLGPVLAQDLLIVSRDDEGRRYGVLVQRRDNGRWAMPGGIEDAQDEAARVPTAVREFLEETYGADPPAALRGTVLDAFARATLVRSGLCPLEARNTDNAWFETTVFLVEVPWPVARGLPLRGSDDARSAALVELTSEVIAGLHGDHPRFVAEALARLDGGDRAV